MLAGKNAREAVYMKRLRILEIIFLAAVVVAVVASSIGCPIDELLNEGGDTFVPVTEITGVPTNETVGTVTLTGTVDPSKATNKTISWSVKDAGTTGGSTVTGKNKVTVTAPGTLKVTATIENGKAQGKDFTQDFSITFTNPKPVAYITSVPTTGTVGDPLTLTGIVVPDNATYTIVWSVTAAGSTGIATGPVTGNKVTATAPGTLEVTATIAKGTAQGTDYTQDFKIEFMIKEVADITGVPRIGTVNTELTLAGTVVPANATKKDIAWSVTAAGGTGIATGPVAGNKVTATAAGTLTVTATIVNGKLDGEIVRNYTKDFDIDFYIMPVTNITDVPRIGAVDTELTLAGTVVPADATNKTIVWSIKDAGGTGATLTGNTVSATTAGTLIVKATIANGLTQGADFTKEFEIEISPFVQVTGISVDPSDGWVGIPFTLNWTVTPANATNKDIVWSVSIDESSTATGTVVGNTVYATTPGTLRVKATIADGLPQGEAFTEKFSITFNDFSGTFKSVEKITGVPQAFPVNTALPLAGVVTPADATNKTIVWSVTAAGGTGIPTGIVTGNTVKATTAGTLKLRATITNGKIVEDGNEKEKIENFTEDFTIKFLNPTQFWR